MSPNVNLSFNRIKTTVPFTVLMVGRNSSNVFEETKNIKGDSIIKYDIKDNTVEVYNTQGFTKDDKTYYKLSDLRNLEV